jgi:P4 family phage/plasmid primase-like protien
MNPPIDEYLPTQAERDAAATVCLLPDAELSPPLPNGTLSKDKPALTSESARTEFEFASLLRQQLPPLKTIGNAWHTYQSGTWQIIESDTVKPKALAVLPENGRMMARAKALLDHLEGESQCDPNGFKGFTAFDDQGRILLNAKNGVVRISHESLELLPHSQEYNFSRQTNAAFNPTSIAPIFARVLSEVLPEKEDQELIQLCLGNFLYPDSRYETCLVCYGEAGRGKSTIADPISAALGLGLVSRLSMSQVCDPRSYHLPALRFSAVNLGTELTTADIAESGNFKTLVSGEPIEARPIYGKPFTMQTACKLWFLANSLPRFRHGTEAELRRMRFLRFDYEPPKRDVTLKGRLLQEIDGIFSFMIEGLTRLMALPEIPLGGEQSRAVHERFRISNDPIGAFVRIACILDPKNKARKDTVKDAYTEFSARYELPDHCKEWFFRALFDRFPALTESRSRVGGDICRYINGLQIKSSMSPDPII